MPRFLTAEEKQQKYNLIFGNAVDMFDHMLFREITMSKLAKKCNIAKGTIFKYFKTKENLFSFILYSEYDTWVEEETEALNSHDEFTAEEFIEFAKYRTKEIFKNHMRLVRLTSIKRTILDKNIEPKLYAELVTKFTLQMKGVAELAASKIKGITLNEMFLFYEAWHMAVVGSYNLGMSTENIKKIKDIGIDNIHTIDVADTAVNSVSYYLRGLIFKKGE